jgi:hypothetical protein
MWSRNYRLDRLPPATESNANSSHNWPASTGFTLRPPQAPRRHGEIDRDRLYTEYVLNRCTLPELAAEKGMTTMKRKGRPS